MTRLSLVEFYFFFRALSLADASNRQLLELFKELRNTDQREWVHFFCSLSFFIILFHHLCFRYLPWRIRTVFFLHQSRSAKAIQTKFATRYVEGLKKFRNFLKKFSWKIRFRMRFWTLIWNKIQKRKLHAKRLQKPEWSWLEEKYRPRQMSTTKKLSETRLRYSRVTTWVTVIYPILP